MWPKSTKINWKIVFIVSVSLLFIKAVFETSLITIKSKAMKMSASRAIKLPYISNEHIEIDSQGKFKVLLWTKWFGFKWIDLINKQGQCQYTNCVYSDDRTKFSSFDAIIFHWYNINPKDLPQEVSDHQKWVLFNMEPPHNTAIGLNSIGLKKIDWIMSYRTDSDIFSPYGSVVKCSTGWKQRHSFENKTKSIAWFVSNCKTPSKREVYAKKLSQYIDVDIYGACGPFKCTKNNDSCTDMIATKYKFYLSFENSICNDYVTEKAFHYMKYDIIPIMLGGANYSAIFPPNSYIDVMNFTSPQHLAEYLRKVGSDRSLYNSYFEWKTNHCVERVDHNIYMCQLCKQLNEKFNTTNEQRREERAKWWSTDANCRTLNFKNDTILLAKI